MFVGTEFDVVDGRGGDGEPRRKTPWGEIAWQLGGEDLFAAVADHDERGIAPAGDMLRRMLPDGPTLILVDELLNYVSRSRKTGLRAQLYNFLQALSEEARARNNLALCVSIPASEIEMNPEDQRDYDAYKKLLDRVGKAISMASETEVNEIIRRRLFDWGGLPTAGKDSRRAYAEWARDHASDAAGLGGDGSTTSSNPATRSTLPSSLSSSANGRACRASSAPGASCDCSPFGLHGPTRRSTGRTRASR